MCYFHATAVDVAFDSTTPPLVGPGVITLRWFDSDSAMIFAERNGGSQYRAQNPGCTIAASLGQGLTPNPIVGWLITYRKNDSYLMHLEINATSGAVIPLP